MVGARDGESDYMQVQRRREGKGEGLAAKACCKGLLQRLAAKAVPSFPSPCITAPQAGVVSERQVGSKEMMQTLSEPPTSHLIGQGRRR